MKRTTAAVENVSSDIAGTGNVRRPTRQSPDTNEVETGVGDGLCRIWDENEACDSDNKSHDRREVEDPMPSRILDEQSTDD